MEFKKGDLLGTSTDRYKTSKQPVARVTKVDRDRTVHCVNLVACATMREGHEFHFVPDASTRYYPLPRD